MRAFIIEKGKSTPSLTNLETLPVSMDYVKTKVLASALNHRDIWITKGLYPGIKYGAVMGADACVLYDGQNYIVNPSLKWGENPNFQSPVFEVLGVPTDGTFSEEIWVQKDGLIPQPKHLDVLQAAALPLAGLTAYRAMMVRGALKKGEKVLISGIGGGVALMALQIALSYGALVYVTSGDEGKIQKAIELGAKGGYLYSDVEWPKKITKDIGGVDVVIDGAGGRGLESFIKISNPGGRIVLYGGTNGQMDGINPQLIFWRQLSILGSTMGSNEDFEAFVNFVNTYELVPIVDSIYSFEQIPLGFQRMAEGKQFGKIVFDHR